MPEAFYTHAELLGLADEAPIRGEFCPRCKNFIPGFADLTDADTKLLYEIRETNVVSAMKRLRELTGCNITFAKIWAAHPMGPHAAKIRPPCPFCEKPLFSPSTRQCLHCNWDWHDEQSPRKLIAEGLARGEAAIREGRVFSNEEARERLKRWLAEYSQKNS